MAFTEFDYSRKWTSADPETGFKTYEDREDKVRADMQFCFDEIRDALNDLGDYVESGDVPVSVDADDVSFTPTPSITSDNVQDAIEEVQANVISAQLGQIVDHSITNAKLSRDVDTAGAAVNRENIQDDAINGDKIDDGAVDYPHLAPNAVRRNAIMNGEVTDDKIENGAPYNKADLITEGSQKYVAKSQSCLRRNNIILYGADNYTLSNNDMMNYIKLTADTAGGMPVYVPYDATIAVGSYCFLECVSGVSEIRPGSGVTLRVNGLDTVSSYAIREAGETLLIIKLASGEWMILPYRHKVITDDLANHAVTFEKTLGVQREMLAFGVDIPRSSWAVIDGGAVPSDTYVRAYASIPEGLRDIPMREHRMLVKPAPETENVSSVRNYRETVNCGVRLASVSGDVLTFHADTIPGSNLQLFVLVF